MRTTGILFASAAFLAGAVAQFSGLPTCAQGCASSALPASCNLDPKCICEAQSFISGVTCCVAKTCSQADQEATIKYAQGICSAAGVTNLPQTAACAATTASGTTSHFTLGTSTGSVMTSMSGTSYTTASTVSSASSAPSASLALSALSTSSASPASTSQTSGTSASSSGTATAATSASSSSAAAAPQRIGEGAIAVGGFAAALVALLLT